MWDMQNLNRELVCKPPLELQSVEGPHILVFHEGTVHEDMKEYWWNPKGWWEDLPERRFRYSPIEVGNNRWTYLTIA